MLRVADEPDAERGNTGEDQDWAAEIQSHMQHEQEQGLEQHQRDDGDSCHHGDVLARAVGEEQHRDDSEQDGCEPFHRAYPRRRDNRAVMFDVRQQRRGDLGNRYELAGRQSGGRADKRRRHIHENGCPLKRRQVGVFMQQVIDVDPRECHIIRQEYGVLGARHAVTAAGFRVVEGNGERQ